VKSWLPYALASAFFAGLTAVLGKAGVSGLDPDFATMIRSIVILLLTAGIVCARGAWRTSDLTARGVTFIALSGVATGMSWLFYYRALRVGPASKVVPVDKLSLAVAMLLAVIFLGEVPNWRAIGGAALILAGTLLVAAA
jgi:transporter family protein